MIRSEYIFLCGLLLVKATVQASPQIDALSARSLDGQTIAGIEETLFARLLKEHLQERAELDDTTVAKAPHLAAPGSRGVVSASIPASFLPASSRSLQGWFRPGPARGPSFRLKQIGAEAEGTRFSGISDDLALASTDAVGEATAISRRMALAGTAWLASSLSLGDRAQAAPTYTIKQIGNPVKELEDNILGLIREEVMSGAVDIPVNDIIRLVIHDAITYDPSTKTGGFSGSIRFPEELKRPENVGLEPAVRKLEALQKRLQEKSGLAISFSDTEALTGAVLLDKYWKALRCTRISNATEYPGFTLFRGSKGGVDISEDFSSWCDAMYEAFGNKGQRLPVGRLDASGPDPEGRVPWVASSAEDFIMAFKNLNVRTKEVPPLAPYFFENEGKGVDLIRQDKDLAYFQGEYEKGFKTPSRNAYEVTFWDAYAKLVNRARFDKAPYGVRP